MLADAGPGLSGWEDTMATIDRVFEGSRLRRGRRAAAPVFMVTAPDGARWRFLLRKDAAGFIDRGCVCPAHDTFLCQNCHGSIQGSAS